MDLIFIYLIICFSSGDVSLCSRKHIETLNLTEDEETKAAAVSLQSFVYYHRLYERWWSNSDNKQEVGGGVSLSAADSRPADEVKEEVVNGGLSGSGENVCSGTRRSDELDFDASLLLCERHAACQAAQRSIREIQERLASMVLHHGKAQGGQPEPGEKQELSSAAEAPDIRGSTDAEQR